MQPVPWRFAPPLHAVPHGTNAAAPGAGHVAPGMVVSWQLQAMAVAAAVVLRVERQRLRAKNSVTRHGTLRMEPVCNEDDEICEVLEGQRQNQLESENEVYRVSKAWTEGTWAADWGPGGPTWPSLVPDASPMRRKVPKRADTLRFDDPLTSQTIFRVVLPTVGALLGGAAIYGPSCLWLQDNLDTGNTGRGPILQLLAMDQSQFMQNFLTVNGLLFTILCGNTYTSLYNQQEILFHALFVEVSEAKSLLEQACLVCQGRPFYPKMLDSIRDYVSTDLRRLDVEPAELLANRPMDDPLEYILYATSVGVPSIIYDTIRDLRQARGQRLGAMQRKLPAIHFVLLYVLGILELMAFPLLGAGTFSMAPDEKILSIQALFFGAMCGAIVMTLQVIYELWKPFGGAYTVDTALSRMVAGLEEELRVRKALWQPNDAAPAPAAAAHLDHDVGKTP